MREQAQDRALDTFSITFPGQAEFDEDRYARQVAGLKGLGYHVDTIDENFLDDFDTIAWHLDEPFAVSSAFATYYLARHAAKKTKVVLTGDGGDELFAGYEGYKNNHYLKGAALSWPVDRVFRLVFASARLTGSGDRSMNRLLNGLRRRSGSEGLRYSEQIAQNSLLASSLAFSQDVFNSSLSAWKSNLVARYYDEMPSRGRLFRKLYAEYKTRLVDEMLMKVDRMTMAHSLEARVPLLDHKVVEFAFGVPSDLKLHKDAEGYQSKYILKKAMGAYLPHDIIYRKKQGFNIPVRHWLEGDFLETIRDKILNGHLRDWGLIDQRGVLELIKGQSEGQPHNSNILMILLAFESWADVYQSRIGGIT
jgi:asparagine synthase (glutamine-hydrolysing)